VKMNREKQVEKKIKQKLKSALGLSDINVFGVVSCFYCSSSHKYHIYIKYVRDRVKSYTSKYFVFDDSVSDEEMVEFILIAMVFE
jgi:hypothetical protein